MATGGSNEAQRLSQAKREALTKLASMGASEAVTKGVTGEDLRKAYFDLFGYYPEDRPSTMASRLAGTKKVGGTSFVSPSTITIPSYPPLTLVPDFTKITPSPKGSDPMKINLWPLIDSVAEHSRRILLFGPPGTGKTYVAATSHVAQRKVYQITMTEDTPAAELRGHFIPKDKEFIWMDGPAVLAWRQGARLVINEIDRASADALSFLFVILDDPEFASFTLPTGEIIKPDAGFQVVATMNGEPNDLPLALQDRFPVSIHVNELNPKALDSLPEDLRTPARNSALAKSDDQRLSIRLWMEFANLRDRMGPATAAQAVFGPRWQEALKVVGMNEVLGELDNEEL